MAEFPSRAKDDETLYRLLIGAVVPRPIAFVSTRDAEGRPNLAPFSFFNAVTQAPPTLAFSVGSRRGVLKDTARNIKAHPEFIVHVVGEDLVERMNVTSGDYGAHVNEFEESGLTPVPGTIVDVPRVREALVAMECRLVQVLTLGRAPHWTAHVIGEVVYWHVDDRVIGPRGGITADALRAVGRMGGAEYARTTDRFSLPRPRIAADDPRAPIDTQGDG